MTTWLEYRPVLVCDHDKPYIVDSRSASCENPKGTQQCVGRQTYRDSDAAMDAAWDHMEYKWSYGHSAHYASTDFRWVSDWETGE
jgi:hypothetical protein